MLQTWLARFLAAVHSPSFAVTVLIQTGRDDVSKPPDSPGSDASTAAGDGALLEDLRAIGWPQMLPGVTIDIGGALEQDLASAALKILDAFSGVKYLAKGGFKRVFETLDQQTVVKLELVITQLLVHPEVFQPFELEYLSLIQNAILEPAGLNEFPHLCNRPSNVKTYAVSHPTVDFQSGIDVTFAQLEDERDGYMTLLRDGKRVAKLGFLVWTEERITPITGMDLSADQQQALQDFKTAAGEQLRGRFVDLNDDNIGFAADGRFLFYDLQPRI